MEGRWGVFRGQSSHFNIVSNSSSLFASLPTALTNRLPFPVLYITETHAVFESEQTGMVEGGTLLPSVPNPPSPDAENQERMGADPNGTVLSESSEGTKDTSCVCPPFETRGSELPGFPRMSRPYRTG